MVLIVGGLSQNLNLFILLKNVGHSRKFVTNTDWCQQGVGQIVQHSRSLGNFIKIGNLNTGQF